MVDTTVEHAIWVIPSDSAFHRLGEASFFQKSIHIDSVEEVATVETAFDLVGLILVRFGCNVPGVSRWVDYTSGLEDISQHGHFDTWILRLTVTPIKGLISVHGTTSELRKGMCKFLEATITPVFALIL